MEDLEGLRHDPNGAAHACDEVRHLFSCVLAVSCKRDRGAR